MSTDRERLYGGVVLARAMLAGSGPSLPVFPVDLARAFEQEMRSLPPQWLAVGHVANSAEWLTFAALVEAHGLWNEAWDLLATMTAELSPGAAESSRPTTAIGTAAARSNLMAFLSARRGRIARTQGKLDLASDCYAAALRQSSRGHAETYWGDVYPSAWLGRSVLAVERGNYPDGRRAARRALAVSIPTAHRSQAQQMLALIERKAGRPDRALTHLWHAYDLSDGHPVHRVAILASLAEVGAEQGYTCAAVRGWLSLLRSAEAGHTVVGVLIALLDAVGRLVREGDPCDRCAIALAAAPWLPITASASVSVPAVLEALNVVAQRIGDDHASSGLPTPQVTEHDRVELLLARARALLTVGRVNDASVLVEAARRDAERLGFHERVFEADSLVHSIQRGGTLLTSQTLETRPRRLVRAQREPAIARFFELSVETTDQETAGV